MVIRAMTPDDVDECVELMAIVAAERIYIGTEAGFDRAEKRARFMSWIERTDRGSLVAVSSEGRVVGQIGLKDMNGLIEIGMLVAPACRSEGIGSALVTTAIEWARGRRAHKLTLQVWPHNQAARALYAKFGFVEEGYRKRHWKRANGEIWDCVVMGLEL